jgi:hypothetical protein
MLRYHPGDLIWGANPLEFDDIPARAVYHFFKVTRPGQRRGIPEITPALSNWPELRRYCDAVIAAAETAADHAMTIQSDGTPDDPDSDPEAMDTVELKKRMATVLPKGYTLGQTRAEQPTTTYGDFTDHKVAEAARCLNMPYSIAALDSSKATTSARYVDGQIYAKAIKIIRKEAQPLPQSDPRFFPDRSDPDPRPHPDGDLRSRTSGIGRRSISTPIPDKVASAQGARLRNGTAAMQDECADDGNDWEDVQTKIAKSLGLTVAEYRERILIPNMLINPPAPAPAGEPPPTP